MKITIFYSWQSDLPNATNRTFIEQAIQKALKAIKVEEDTVLEACLERDTAGVSGTPDIAATIFRKIDECQVFIGDVSIINQASNSDRKTPNPNVLLELGYAAKTLTWDNVICVFNTTFGSMADLPFDLRLRRMCTFAVTKEQESKSEERDNLARKFKEALLPILKRLAVKVQAEAAPKPLTPDAAGAKVKEFLADDRHRIPLKDLVMVQGNEMAQKIVGPGFPVQVPSLAAADVKQRIQQYEEISQVALAIMVAGCYYGTQAQDKLWIDLLQRVANPQGEQAGSVVLLNLRRYPALLLLYGGGIAAVAGEHYETLLALLTRPKLINERRGGDDPPLQRLTPYDVIDKNTAVDVIGKNFYTPMSEHFFQSLRELFRAFLPDDRQYHRCFNCFEYLRSLLEVDSTGEVQTVGRYGLRSLHPDQDVRRELEVEEGAAGRKWLPYQAGWFNGQRERFMTAKKKVDEMVAGLGWR